MAPHRRRDQGRHGTARRKVYWGKLGLYEAHARQLGDLQQVGEGYVGKKTRVDAQTLLENTARGHTQVT